jgi:TolA-binding protein
MKLSKRATARQLVTRTIAFLALWTVICGGPAQAAPVTFFGEDLNSTDNPNDNLDAPLRPASLPNADAARAAFLANLVGAITENFESFAVGATTPLTLTFGADTATLFGQAGTNQILAVPTGTFNGAFPTSGNQFLLQFGPSGSFQIDFGSPQAAFGFYATDVADGGAQLNLTFSHVDGSQTALNVPHAVPSGTGSAFYFGVIIADNPFIRATFSNTNSATDGFGFDDMTIARAEQVTFCEGSGQEVETLQQQVAQLQVDLTTCNTTNTGLQDQLDATDATIAQLQGQLDASNATIVQVQGDLTTCNATNTGLQDQLDAANATIAQLQGDLITCNATNTGLQDQLDATNATIASFINVVLGGASPDANVLAAARDATEAKIAEAIAVVGASDPRVRHAQRGFALGLDALAAGNVERAMSLFRAAFRIAQGLLS